MVPLANINFHNIYHRKYKSNFNFGSEGLLKSAVAGGLKNLILICSLATGQLSIRRGGPPVRFGFIHIACRY